MKINFARRVAIVLLCAVATVSLSADSRHKRDRDRDTVWVANRDLGTVAVFDAASGDLVELIPDLPGVHDIGVSHRTGKVFVSDDASRVYVLSAATRDLIDTIQFAAGSRPHHLSVSHDEKTVWVGLFSRNAIAAIDTRTHDVRELPSSTSRTDGTAHAPLTSPNDRVVFVPHEGQNYVTKVSARTGNELGAVTLGTAANSGPSEVLATRDGELLFVSMRNEDTVRTIDVDSFEATGDPVTVGDQPESLILTPGEQTLIVSLRGTPARLAFIDTEEMELETLDIAPSGTNGDLAVPSPDGRYVYATFNTGIPGTGGVVKVDAFKRKILATFTYPSTGRPHGLTYVQGHDRRGHRR